MKQETIAVPVELVRELKAAIHIAYQMGLSNQMATLLARLPDPPKPDVVEECERARLNSYSRGPMAGDFNWHAMRAALRRYRELGCPELDDVVEECAKAYYRADGGPTDPDWGDLHPAMRVSRERRTRAALRRYRELRGLPTDPELEE